MQLARILWVSGTRPLINLQNAQLVFVLVKNRHYVLYEFSPFLRQINILKIKNTEKNKAIHVIISARKIVLIDGFVLCAHCMPVVWLCTWNYRKLCE